MLITDYLVFRSRKQINWQATMDRTLELTAVDYPNASPASLVMTADARFNELKKHARKYPTSDWYDIILAHAITDAILSYVQSHKGA